MAGKVTIEIRRATANDASLLAEMGARTFYESFAAQNTEEDMAVYLESAFTVEKLAGELAEESAVFLIAEAPGQAVGYTKLQASEPDPCVRGERPMELCRIYCDSVWQGCGVGSLLMQAAHDLARSQGAKTLWLGVWERNPRAIAFYERWGFHDVGSHIFVVGSDPQTDRIMQVTLSSQK
jgi:GNAT superfamily N-acetyltransferase